MDQNIYFKCLALTYTFSLVPELSARSLADRFHPLRISLAALALYALVMVCGGLWVRDATSFAVAFVAQGVVFGSASTAWASLPQRLLPRDKFAEIGSVGGVIGALSTMLLAPVLGPIPRSCAPRLPRYLLHLRRSHLMALAPSSFCTAAS